MYKLLLCLRYLRTRYIALASIVSVMLGVATMIVVNSVMAGFSTEMRERIHGILADVIVETITLDGVEDPEQQMALARMAAGDYIEAMTTTVEVYGMLNFQYAGQYMTKPVTLIGIQPESKAKVGPLVSSLDSYNSVKDGDIVVRPPLRLPSDPPGWELTADAFLYRKEWIEHQLLFPNLNAEEMAFSLGEASPAVDPDFNPFTSSANTDATNDDTADGAIEAVPSDNSPASADPLRQAAATDDLFQKLSGGSANLGGADSVNPYAPKKCRVYLGAGLVDYPYEDHETGRIKNMRMVRPGDDVQLSTVTAARPPTAAHFSATVVDIFKSGMSEYDANLVFCNLEYLQEARGMIHPTTGKRSITSIQIKLKDYADSDEVVRLLRGAFPPGVFSVRTWEQKQGPLLAAVEIESAILNVLLFLIIAVAGFGILAIFFMIVVEKTRDIGILKALGASSRGVMSIFLSYGLALGVVGSGVGVGLGLLFVHYINEIEEFITLITGRKVFDERIYYFPAIPTAVNPSMVIWVACGAMAIAVVASILPARRASRLHPVEALRYE